MTGKLIAVVEEDSPFLRGAKAMRNIETVVEFYGAVDHLLTKISETLPGLSDDLSDEIAAVEAAMVPFGRHS